MAFSLAKVDEAAPAMVIPAMASSALVARGGGGRAEDGSGGQEETTVVVMVVVVQRAYRAGPTLALGEGEREICPLLPRAAPLEEILSSFRL